MIRVAIIGYGYIGKAVEQALQTASDMKLVGIYHHDDNLDNIPADVAILGVPSREVPNFAPRLLSQGIATVDSFDIHTEIVNLRHSLMPIAEENKTVSIISAGWDPGSDSVIRTLMMALTPKGITYTNFGPGRSMGHSVAAKSIEGVKDALSLTIPIGTGLHRRMVYIELEKGANFEEVEKRILADDYFAHDETHVIQVDDVDALNNVEHGVLLTRDGVSGTTHNQRLTFQMTINNPALTGQILVGCARAAYRLRQEKRFGTFTLPEIPPIYLLQGDTDTLIRSLV